MNLTQDNLNDVLDKDVYGSDPGHRGGPGVEPRYTDSDMSGDTTAGTPRPT